MGYLRLEDLVEMVVDPDQSVPIGSEPRRVVLTATHSYINQSHEVEFGEEIPIQREFGLAELPADGTETESKIWVGFEVQSKEKKLEGNTLVLAVSPYSVDWFDWADFKPTAHRSAEQRLKPLRGLGGETARALQSIDSLRYDPFETRSGWYTARLSLPTRTNGLATTGHTRSKTEKVWRAVETNLRRWQRKGDYGSWCYGACRGFETCRQLLKSSVEAQDLLARTDDGTLFDSFKKQGAAPQKDLGVYAKSLRHQVLDSAAIKCLAGIPPKQHRIADRKLSPALLMTFIYIDTMYNLCRRLDEAVSDSIPAVNGSGPLTTAPEQSGTPFDELVEKWLERFKKRPPAEAVRLGVEKQLAEGGDEETCALVVGAFKAGYRIQSSTIALLKNLRSEAVGDTQLRDAVTRTLALVTSEDVR